MRFPLVTASHESAASKNFDMRFVWLATYFAALVWSAVNPHDYFTWFLEAAPALIALAVLAATHNGAHYTYAAVDIFKWVRDFFAWQRNNYDKLGHFAQGFVPAIIAREIFIRNHVVNGRTWLNLFVISICLAFSALYELFEWGVAVATGDSAESFLGTQGYMWDTQSDMAMALMGALLSLVILSKLHDKQLHALAS